MTELDEQTAPLLAKILSSLQAALLITTEGVDRFLTELARLGAAMVNPSRTSCGITVRRDHQPYTVASGT